MKQQIKRKTIAALAAAASIAMLAGCSGAPGETPAEGPGTNGELVPVKVGTMALADNAPLYFALDQGFFEDQGLDVEIQVLSNGAAVTAAVIAGDSDFGYSNPISLILANSRGLPVTVVSGGVAAGQDAQGGSDSNAAILVPADSDITDIKGLRGRTVAVNALGNILEVTLKNALEAEGIDPESVNLVEVPFPEMQAALAGGQVDATFILEPFLTMSKLQDNSKAVAFPYEVAAKGLQAGLWFTTTTVLERDGETVKAFQAGMKRAVDYFDANPDAARQAIPTFLKIPGEIVAEMNLPSFVTKADVDHLKLFVKLGKRYNIVKGDVDLDVLTAGLAK